jgi:tetratricopeptide (TPR) repeat protein
MLAALVLASGVAAPPVAAQTRATVDRAKEEEERTALYREGVALAEAGRWYEALEKFQKVVAIRSAPPALVALATAQEKVGKLVSAKRTYLDARAQALALRDAGLAERAERALTALHQHIARIVVVLPPDTSGAELAVDGSAVSNDPGGIELDPGERLVVVRASRRRTFQQRVLLTAGERKEIVVRFDHDLSAESPASTSTPALATATGDTARAGPPIGSWVLGGAGVAASVTGLLLHFNGRARYDDAASQCTDSRCATLGEVEAGNAERDRVLAGSIVFGAGLALVAGAGLWWALTPSASHPESAQSARRQISMSPTPLPGGAAMIVRGNF